VNLHQFREHVRMLVAFAGVESVAAVAGVPVVQVTRATHSGKATPHAQMRLESLGLANLGECPLFNAKGTTLRLRALYAMGYTSTMLAPMMETGHRQVGEILNGERDWVRAAAHNRAKYLFVGVQMAPEPEGSWADNARKRARSKLWLRPIELEEDLIDVPEPWASGELAARASEMDYAGQTRAYKAVRQGERSELAVAASVAYQSEYNRRRREKEAV